MRLQTFGTKPHPPCPAARPLRSSRTGYDLDGLYEEQSWRSLPEDEASAAIEADILVSRWVDPRSSLRHEKTVSSSDRHVIGVALKTTRLKLTRGAHTVFDGIMPAGTVQVTGPSQPLTAEFRAPCDFIHFHVSNDYLRELQHAARPDPSQPFRDLNDLVVRDPLAELLGRTLVESGNSGDFLYAESVGQTLVMHIARLESARPTVNALPKWRLKRVQEYVDAHLEQSISLADLAKVVGLSRMHFAAQFRAATGYRPHDYLLYQRIETAKAILSSTEMPLAEVALTVGFHAQAHFSTVFKRLTGETPARWRCSARCDRALPQTIRRSVVAGHENRIAASM
jgi:AraC family transcriptional regulator